MYNVFLLADHSNGALQLLEALSRLGMACQVGNDLPMNDNGGTAVSPQAVVLDMASVGPARSHELVTQCKTQKFPGLVVVPSDNLANFDPTLNPDEFILGPVRDEELNARLKQAVYRVNSDAESKVVSIDELVVDLERYDVTVAGRRVSLTYKEFQLLALLASNPGRVYTREALLSQVWGYDYLGGTRTVDVHVRRLRSKVEAPGRSFVETIWNVGYRFKAPS